MHDNDNPRRSSEEEEMEIGLWIMFGLSVFAMASSFMSVSKAADHIMGMAGFAIFGFALIVYYLAR